MFDHGRGSWSYSWSSSSVVHKSVYIWNHGSNLKCCIPSAGTESVFVLRLFPLFLSWSSLLSSSTYLRRRLILIKALDSRDNFIPASWTRTSVRRLSKTTFRRPGSILSPCRLHRGYESQVIRAFCRTESCNGLLWYCWPAAKIWRLVKPWGLLLRGCCYSAFVYEIHFRHLVYDNNRSWGTRADESQELCRSHRKTRSWCVETWKRRGLQIWHVSSQADLGRQFH